MEWTSEKILESFYGIVRDSKNLSKQELEHKYSDFKESHSKLYEVIIHSIITGDVQNTNNMLIEMLKTKANMDSGHTTKMVADVTIGQKLANKYIYSKTGAPKTEDYKQALDKIKEKYAEQEKEQSQ